MNNSELDIELKKKIITLSSIDCNIILTQEYIAQIVSLLQAQQERIKELETENRKYKCYKDFEIRFTKAMDIMQKDEQSSEVKK